MDTFFFEACDPLNLCVRELVIVNVLPVNDPPVAVNDVVTTGEDLAIVVASLSNDSDVDNDRLTVTITTPPTNGNATTNGTTITYTPDPNYNGADNLTYTVTDIEGSTSSATVSFTVIPVNDAPQFTAAATNTSQTINGNGGEGLVALQATDVENDPLTYTLLGGSLPSSISLQSNGTFMGTADVGLSGVFSATIQVSDGNGGTTTTALTVTLNSTNCTQSANWSPFWGTPLVVGDQITITLDASTPVNTGIEDAEISISFGVIVGTVNNSTPTILETWIVGSHPPGTMLTKTYVVNMDPVWTSVTLDLIVTVETCKAQHVGRADQVIITP